MAGQAYRLAGLLAGPCNMNWTWILLVVAASASLNSDGNRLLQEGSALVKLGQFEGALQIYSEAVRLIPTSAPAYHHKGVRHALSVRVCSDQLLLMHAGAA